MPPESLRRVREPRHRGDNLMPVNRVGRRQALLAIAALAAFPSVKAQSFPSRPVRLVLPQPPGGAADRLARVLSERLEARWKQSVLVENKPGGGVVIGTQTLVRAPADGLTLGLLGSSLTINAVQRKDLPYEMKDLQPIARIGYYTNGLLAHASFPADDIKGLIELARTRPPGTFMFGSNGIGTSAQVAGEMLNHLAGIELQHVPYNGAAKMYVDMIGGVVPLGFSVLSSAEAYVKAGTLKVLGVTSAQRSPLFPHWPAIAETLPGYEAVNWAGILAPVGLPRDVLQRLSTDLVDVLNASDMPKLLSEMGIEHAVQGPDEFAAFIASELRNFGALTKPLAPRLN
jgi:tripartite-type tricarboxylate transporter receptor subunit TctC